MKNYLLSLFVSIFVFVTPGASQTDFGCHFTMGNVFLKTNSESSDHYGGTNARLGYQAGTMVQTRLNNWLSLRGEANYTHMGYIPSANATLTGLDKVSYHYAGLTALTNFHCGRVLSLDAGAAANYLIGNPNDIEPVFEHERPRFDVAFTGGFSLRYDEIEVRVRYQQSLRPFTIPDFYKAWFRFVGIGLGYYFL